MTENRRVTRRKLLLGTGAVLATGIAGGAMTSRRIVVERRTLALPRWDASGFRIVQLTDVHLDHERAVRQAQEAVRIALAEKPDVIVFTGDFVTKAIRSFNTNIATAFNELHDAACPCLAVPGNHDYWGKDIDHLQQMVNETPFRLLRNEFFDIAGVTIAGIDDGLFGRGNPSFLRTTRKSHSLISLFHEPDFVDWMPQEVSLQLSGHSHGGEVCLPGGFALHTPSAAKRYISGFYPNAPVPLYVSRGIATLSPMRIYCPPEVAVLTLVSA